MAHKTLSEIRIWATHVSSSPSLFTYCRSTPGSLDLSRLGKGGIGIGGGVGACAEEEGRGAAGISPPLKDDIEEEEVLEEDGVENLTSLSLRKTGNPEFEDGSEKAEEDEKNIAEDDVEPAQDLSKSGDRSPVAEEEEEAKGE